MPLFPFVRVCVIKPVHGFNEQGGGEDASLFNSSVDSETVGYVSLTDSLTVEIGLQGLDDVDYFGRDSIVESIFHRAIRWSVEGLFEIKRWCIWNWSPGSILNTGNRVPFGTLILIVYCQSHKPLKCNMCPTLVLYNIVQLECFHRNLTLTFFSSLWCDVIPFFL